MKKVLKRYKKGIEKLQKKYGKGTEKYKKILLQNVFLSRNILIKYMSSRPMNYYS
ncbi:hypothetical protein CI610_02749 [invertebrate metagenome]|uniref:Uncharacterized protein n=1 Tax=invertebrate metagenome TaxID=1711999 RepID=A0A2H9T517_9ZZZZ